MTCIFGQNFDNEDDILAPKSEGIGRNFLPVDYIQYRTYSPKMSKIGRKTTKTTKIAQTKPGSLERNNLGLCQFITPNFKSVLRAIICTRGELI